MIGDISLRVLTYNYCAYFIQSLHMNCAVKVIREHSLYDNLGEDKSYRNTNGL